MLIIAMKIKIKTKLSRLFNQIRILINIIPESKIV